MANYITTLKDDNGTNNLLPKTVLKAVADDNGNYLDNGLAASDINKLKGGEIVKLEENLARIETSPTTHAYSVGERLVYNGILYRVKAAISIGDDLVVNTNIEKKSVDDALSDINTQINGLTVLKGMMTADNSFTFRLVNFESAIVMTARVNEPNASMAFVTSSGVYYLRQGSNASISYSFPTVTVSTPNNSDVAVFVLILRD